MSFISVFRISVCGRKLAGVFMVRRHGGFALISCLLVMSLLMVVSVGLLRFSVVESGGLSSASHVVKARANARVALVMALSQLQSYAGRDEVVTGRADMLADRLRVSHRNWVGAWGTVRRQSGGEMEWPLIGKKTIDGNGVYADAYGYSDLRYTDEGLSDGKWRRELHRGWLVSGSNVMGDVSEDLDVGGEGVLEILGRGALGAGVSEDAYLLGRVLVKKLSLGDGSGIAWWTFDNHLKAGIKSSRLEVSDHEVARSVSPNLSHVGEGGDYSLRGFQENLLEKEEKVISMGSGFLAQEDAVYARVAFGRYVHDLTDYSPGMFIDTARGGFQRDLTPLLFGKKGERRIEFEVPYKGMSDDAFTSEHPIVCGIHHDVLGPTFSALRYWGLQKYMVGGEFDTVLDISAGRHSPGAGWPHGVSDGFTYDAARWSDEVPKRHPVMTDTRWHYYFSIHGDKIRTHIIPRVCLWNPYNRDMVMRDMIALMPNPFYRSGGGVHFYFDDDEVERLRGLASDGGDVVHRWVKKSANPLGDKYKARLKVSGESGLFVGSRYLAFTLKGVKLGAGECHVFSPSIDSGSVSGGDVKLARYEEEEISKNVLRSDSRQGGDHFYYDMGSSDFEVQTSSGWRLLSGDTRAKLDLGAIHDYRLETGRLVENFPFILKSSRGEIPLLSVLMASEEHPTLQLINNGLGGVSPAYYFGYSGASWGSANTVGSFGSMQRFVDAPGKDAPATHQVGAKLLWLDESTTEGNKAPLRYGTTRKTRWGSEHMVYHPAVIANWNVRSQLTSRSPASQCGKAWYLFSAGPWMLQFVPKSPQDANDSPQLNATGSAFIKHPFGLAVDHAVSPEVVLFDMPDSDFGIHSMATLRHVMMSPYSWHPSYVVGHSLRDLHAPSYSTVHAGVVAGLGEAGGGHNHWDLAIGGYRSGFSYGAANAENDSDGLLQLGGMETTRHVGMRLLRSGDDILPYDIAYEVNESLWNGYFISSLPVSGDGEGFSSASPENQRYVMQVNEDVTREVIESHLLDGDDAFANGFWMNGYFYKRKGAFNVNSTSEVAWSAFLSSTVGVKRELRDGSTMEGREGSFSRFSRPEGLALSRDLEPRGEGAWQGLRVLDGEEIRRLASAIVDEVKLRGPFISLSDFVNRRLTVRDDETSEMGALDAAIYKAGLNQVFYDDDRYNTSLIDRGSDPLSADNNHRLFRDAYLYSDGGQVKSSQAVTKTWGLPSFLMQSDLLEPLAPSMTVRGDTFTIRAYGESSENGRVVARAFLEAVVERSPHYMNHQSVTDESEREFYNKPTDMALDICPLTGTIKEGDLSGVNKVFGRRYRVKSFRWLNENEV